MQRIGILSSGGDAPGMNAAIRAAVRTASRNEIEVIAYLDGYTGLVENRSRVLDDREVGNIIHRGGTFIGTSRCRPFLNPDIRREAAKLLRRQGIEGLIVIGGDGTFRGALALEEEHGVRIAGITGTIDNDVYGTDETIGFDTAVNTAVHAIDQIRDTGVSTGMMFIVEVMGRTSGAIAMHTALAAGASGVLVPEAQDEIDVVIEQIRQAESAGKRSHIVVVAEGEEPGGAFAVGERLAAILHKPYRVVVLGHVQRGGSPSVRDRLLASQSGAMAVELLAAGCSGMMIGFQRGMPVQVPLREVVANVRPAPRLDLLQLAKSLAG